MHVLGVMLVLHARWPVMDTDILRRRFSPTLMGLLCQSIFSAKSVWEQRSLEDPPGNTQMGAEGDLEAMHLSKVLLH